MADSHDLVRAFETSFGALLQFGNEIAMVSKIADPVAYRGCSPEKDGAWLKLSAGYQKTPDPKTLSDIEERVVIIFKADQNPGVETGAGCIEIAIARDDSGGDAAMTKVVELTSRGIKFLVPVQFADGHADQPANRVSRFYSDDGRYAFNVQGDATPEYPKGRIVQYEIHDPQDEATWTPVAILRPDLL